MFTGQYSMENLAEETPQEFSRVYLNQRHWADSVPKIKEENIFVH